MDSMATVWPINVVVLLGPRLRGDDGKIKNDIAIPV